MASLDDRAKSFRYLRKSARLLHNLAVQNYFSKTRSDRKYKFSRIAYTITEQDSALIALLRMFVFYILIIAKGKLNDPPVLPDRWQRHWGDIPQLKVIYKGSRGYYPLSIPHWRLGVRETQKLSLPEYSKGSYTLCVRFRDNSKVIINAYSYKEADRVWNALKPFVSPDFRQTAELQYYKTDKRQRAERVKPYKAKLFGEKEAGVFYFENK